MSPATHPLRLTAPWYRWQRQADEDGAAPRATRPVLQKYDGAKLVQHFLDDPQRSYRFTDEDHAHVVEASPYAGQIRKLADVRRERCAVRKLFRAAHRRTYLVVGELHCDLPGFPDADAGVTCEMGFVVRRRVALAPGAVAARRAELSEQIGVDRAGVLRLDRRRLGLGAPANLVDDPRRGDPGSPFFDPVWEPGTDGVRRRLALYRSELAGLRSELCGLAALEADGVATELQGWFPDPDREGTGAWRALDDEEPGGRVEERVHPLSVYRPDPRNDPAQGATLLFGMVPTDLADVDGDGAPRFDGRAVYEIRLFVRRHDPRCPRRDGPADCKGPLVWSPATEAFRIAGHDDPDGTRHNVVTVEMPDLRDLAAATPPGGVRLLTPDGSNMNIEADGSSVTGGSLGGGQICSLPILLITLVARFVFALFLPVVVLVFQLFFLLRLKICIPPSVEISAGLSAAVAAAGPDFDADLSVKLQLQLQFDGMLGPSLGGGASPGTALTSEYSNSELWAMLQEMTSHAGPVPPAGGGDALVWEERVVERPRVGRLLLTAVSA